MIDQIGALTQRVHGHEARLDELTEAVNVLTEALGGVNQTNETQSETDNELLQRSEELQNALRNTIEAVGTHTESLQAINETLGYLTRSR